MSGHRALGGGNRLHVQGVSTTVKIRSGPRSGPSTSRRNDNLNLKQQAIERERGRKRRHEEMQGLPADDRNHIKSLSQGGGDATYVDEPLDSRMEEPEPDGSDWEDEVPDQFDLASAGQKYQVFVDAISGTSFYTTTRRHQDTNRTDQVLQNAALWEPQYPRLVQPYLHWKATSSKVEPPSAPSLDPSLPQSHDHFTVNLLSLHHYNPNFPVLRTEGAIYASESLIAAGLISNSPSEPLFAFSLLTLETFHRLRLRAPRTSIQAFLKTIFDTHGTVFPPHIATAFTDALDVYFHLLRLVDQQVATALGRNAPNWRIRHSCPACQYKIVGEEQLQYDVLVSIDGGSSLKCFANAGSASHGLTFLSDYYVGREDVDAFAKPAPATKGAGKGKKKAKKGAMENEVGDDEADAAMEITADNTGDDWVVKNASIGPLAGDDIISICVERWKANADDSKKGMFDCFEESGVFIAACRHGFVLAMADMVCSGELAKYPLAVLKKVNDALPKQRLLVGYDIGCTFQKTVERSSLGDTLDADFTIPAMHGYAHNRLCQCTHHPMYLPGTGLEDFEGCERFFPATNNLARVTRHATRFHRLQAIDMLVRQWDEDKYLALGTFLLNNYRQAKTIVVEYTDLLNQQMRKYNIAEADFAHWLEEEKSHLVGLTHEPEEDTLGVAYVEALQNLQKAEAEAAVQRGSLSNPVLEENDDPSKMRVKLTYKKAQAKVQRCEEVVNDLEAELDVRARWTPSSAEYKAAFQYMRERKFRLALDHLERLVVQRLFELQKGHLESTGYRLRVNISKHLKARSETIRTALKAYNTAAAAIGKPKIDFQDLMNTTFIADFDLLRDSRTDIRQKPWADPVKRVIHDQWFKLQHAKEEIKRLNVEIVRLRTWIHDENQLFKSTTDRIATSDPALSQEITARGARQFSVNSWIMKSLDRVGQDGLSGIRWHGTSEEAATLSPATSLPPPTPSIAASTSPGDGDDAEDGEDSEDSLEQQLDDADRIYRIVT